MKCWDPNVWSTVRRDIFTGWLLLAAAGCLVAARRQPGTNKVDKPEAFWYFLKSYAHKKIHGISK